MPRGASVRGSAEPITVNIKRTREGLGCPSEAPAASSAVANDRASDVMLQDFRSTTVTVAQ